MGIQLNRHQVETLLAHLNDSDFDDEVVEVEFQDVGEQGPGVYCWYPEYPEDGKSFLESVSPNVKRCEAIVSAGDKTPAIDAVPDASGDGKKPMTAWDLLQWLRQDFEDHIDTGGETWWVKDLAEELELPELTLLDRDHDSGLLFELKQDGYLSYHWFERNKDQFDYLVWLNGGRIEWD